MPTSTAASARAREGVKQPTDHLRAVEDGAGDYTFEHPLGSGQYFTVPSMAHIKSGTLRKARKGGDVDLMYAVIEQLLAGEEHAGALEATDDMELSRLQEVFSDWQKAAGAGVGESQRSSI